MKPVVIVRASYTFAYIPVTEVNINFFKRKRLKMIYRTFKCISRILKDSSN